MRTVSSPRFPAKSSSASWFHDAIYVPGACGNERRSADLAANFLDLLEFRPSARVRNHVLAAEHEVEPQESDSALVVDVDLAILGRDALRRKCGKSTNRSGPLYR